MSDVRATVRALQKEHRQLHHRRDQLRKQMGVLRQRVAVLDKEAEAIESRILDIDHAFEPLTQLGKPEAIPSGPLPATAIPRGQTMQDIVKAIGKHGLDEYRAADIARESGVEPNMVATALSTLCREGRIHRIERGLYRTIKAKVA